MRIDDVGFTIQLFCRWSSLVGRCHNAIPKVDVEVANLDSTLILSEPKMGPHTAAIRARISELVGIPGASIGIKAKTPEGMGNDNAAIAHVAVLLEEVERPAKPKISNNKTKSKKA